MSLDAVLWHGYISARRLSLALFLSKLCAGVSIHLPFCCRATSVLAFPNGWETWRPSLACTGQGQILFLFSLTSAPVLHGRAKTPSPLHCAHANTKVSCARNDASKLITPSLIGGESKTMSTILKLTSTKEHLIILVMWLSPDTFSLFRQDLLLEGMR